MQFTTLLSVYVLKLGYEIYMRYVLK